MFQPIPKPLAGQLWSQKVIGRREFMALSAAATALALENVGSNVAVAGAPAAATRIDVKTATSTTFKALVGQSFEVSGTKQKFVLDQVTVFNDPNKAKRPRGIRAESFLLVFSAPANTKLPEGTYTFTSAKRAKFEVWMSKTGTTSLLSTKSPLGQAELYVSSVAKNVSSTPAKGYYQVPFN